MAQTSWPFYDSETGGTPVYEDEWSIMARAWAASGVVGYPNDSQLQVYANSSGREVHVRAGRASVRGHWLDLDAQMSLEIAANTSGNPRIDYVVARLDPSEDGVTITVIEGTPAGSPAAPTLTATDTGLYDLPLATVAVANGDVTVSAGNVTDRRQYASPPPMLCLSTRRPAPIRVGQTIIETDTGLMRWWNGSQWPLVAQDIRDDLDALDDRIVAGVWTGLVTSLGGVAVVPLPDSPTGNWSVIASMQSMLGYALPVVFAAGPSSVSIAVYIMDTFGGLASAPIGESVSIHYHAIAC